MVFKVISRETLAITYSYIANDKDLSIGFLCAHLPCPAGLDPDCVKAVLVDDVITLVEDPALVAVKAAAAKQALVAAARDAMLADIAIGQKQVYGTASETSALTFHLTFVDMVASPTDWVGAQFATAEEVLAYAAPKLAASKAFGLVRLARIAQYEAEVVAILA
jgi:hypothetical protein